MYIGRNEDGSIYGLWTVKQYEGQEEKPENDSEIIAFLENQKSMINRFFQK